MSVPPQFLLTARAERMIAVARLALTAASTLAFWIDPSEPIKYAGITRVLTTGYTAWAIVVFVVSRSTILTRRWQFSTHAIDLLVCLLVMNLTEGIESPFFLYLLFALMAATVRWAAPGALWTGAATLLVFFGTVTFELARRGPLDWNLLMVRGMYLVVLGLMLAYLGQYTAEIQETTQRLRTWRAPAGVEMDQIMAEASRYAADILGSPRAVAVWDDVEEPDVRLTWWPARRVPLPRTAESVFTTLVTPSFQGTDFLCRDVSRGDSPVVFTFGSALATAPGPAVDQRFVDQYTIRTLLAARCAGGWLFVIDKPQLTIDDLWLAQIVAHQVTSSVEQALLLRRLEETRVVEARGRVARDLHDGVLQSLTAITLRLQTLAPVVDVEARLSIDRLQTLIADEARRLRRFIQELTAKTPDTSREVLAERLEGLRQHIEQDWDLRVEITTTDLDRLPGGMERDVYFLAREALINVARHATASTARVRIAIDKARLSITISDDGGGFAFEGRRDGATLAAAGLAPRMLYERLTSLGGRLVVDSRATGSRVDIEVPLPESERC